MSSDHSVYRKLFTFLIVVYARLISSTFLYVFGMVTDFIYVYEC